MAKWAPDAMLDASLDYMAASDTLIICSSQPDDYAGALSTALATVSLTPDDGNGDFAIADGDAGGRKVTVTAQSGVTVDTTGTATHVALCLSSDTTLRFVTTCASQDLTATGKCSVPSWKYTIGDPGVAGVLSVTLRDSTLSGQGTVGTPATADATITTDRSAPLMTSALHLEFTPVHEWIENDDGNATTRQAAVDLMSTFPGAIYNQHTYGFGIHIINQYGLYEAFESGTQLAGKLSTSGTVTGETWASAGGTLAISGGRLQPTTTGQATLSRFVGSTFTILANFNLGADGTNRSWNIQFRRSAGGNYVYCRVRKLANGSCVLEFWEWTGSATALNPTGQAFATPLAADTEYVLRLYVVGTALKAQVWNADQSTLLKEITATSTLNPTEKTVGIHCPEAPATGQWLDNFMAFEWNWSTWNTRLNLIASCGGELAITGWNAPDWIKNEETYDPVSVFDDDDEVQTKYYPVYAAWLLEIVRYSEAYGMMPHSLAVWNELKGMWDNTLNNMDYISYSDMFSQVYKLIKPAYPSLPIGGPYKNHSFDHSDSARGGLGGINSSGVRFLEEFFTRVKVLHGADVDYVTFDGANITWNTEVYPLGTQTLQEKLDLVMANAERQGKWCAHIKEIAAQAVGDMSNPPTSLGGLGVANKEVASKEHYIMSYATMSDNRFTGMSHQFQAMAYARMIRAMILNGLDHAYHWQMEGYQQFAEDGDQQSLYRDTADTANGGQPFELYYTFKTLRENFYAGTSIYTATSDDADIVPLSSATHTLLIHKAQATKMVNVNGTIVSLGPEEVLLVDG